MKRPELGRNRKTSRYPFRRASKFCSQKANENDMGRPFMNASKGTNCFFTVIKVPFLCVCVCGCDTKLQALPHTLQASKNKAERRILGSFSFPGASNADSEVNIRRLNRPGTGFPEKQSKKKKREEIKKKKEREKERIQGGEGKIKRKEKKGRAKSKGRCTDHKPSGSVFSLRWTCFSGQQKISWHLVRKGDCLFFSSVDWMESCRNIIYSCVPGEASSITAVTTQQK